MIILNEQYIEFEEDFLCKSEKHIFLGISIGNNTSIGKGTRLYKGVTIGSDVKIGRNCFIGNNSLIRNNVCIGDNNKIGFSCSIEPHAKIGNNNSTQGFCMFAEYGIVGDGNFFGPYWNSLGDNTIGKPKGEYIANPPIIGNNCRFGSTTKVVPNIKIADGTITGAMTLLTKDTEINSLYYGVPAKFIKKLGHELEI